MHFFFLPSLFDSFLSPSQNCLTRSDEDKKVARESFPPFSLLSPPYFSSFLPPLSLGPDHRPVIEQVRVLSLLSFSLFRSRLVSVMRDVIERSTISSSCASSSQTPLPPSPPISKSPEQDIDERRAAPMRASLFFFFSLQSFFPHRVDRISEERSNGRGNRCSSTCGGDEFLSLSSKAFSFLSCLRHFTWRKE